ncbi:MAG TPA: carboxypeptidase regulatory-like domain-containing protein [Gemmatimonadales bacterium]|nr:carboxypeptidase regulatory-like domain-containing protein [Gemmatimonadales bacterium]
MVLVPVIVLLQAAAAVAPVPPAGAVTGKVRDGTAQRPLADVSVSEAGRLTSLSDSAGGYRLDNLSPGSHQLRFAREGYDTLVIGVLVADSGLARVDVELMPQPVRLATLQVVGTPMPPPAAGPADDAELDRVRLDGDWLDHRLAGTGDVLQALADLPGMQASGERSAGVHVRGGATAENLILLDGIPVFSAVHYAGSASAVNPDAVAAAELHPGVSSARFGDHLSGVVELETRDAGSDPFAARGALGSGEVRQSLSSYIPALHTGISIGGRTTYRNALMGEGYDGDATAGSGYHDLLTVATSELAGGRLRALSFFSSNTLAFPAFGDNGSYSDAPSNYVSVARNDVAWNSWSQGVTWNRSDTRVKLETAAWAAGSSADVAWRGAEGPERLRSTLAQLGLSGRVAWPSADGGTSLGGSVVRSSTGYAVTGSGGLTLDAAPTLASVFAEHQWRPVAPVLVSAGLRASTDFDGWTGLEPRVSASVEPDARTRLGVAVGRSHQILQSVVNDESALGLLLGFDLPVAAGAGSLPVARADQLEASAAREIGGGLDLSVTAYLRRTDGIALGAASTRDFFPGDSLVVGSGNASGVTGTVSVDRGAVRGRVFVTVARDVRTAGSLRYRTGYGNGTSVGADLGYRFLTDTRFLLRFRSGAHEPASVVEPGFDYQPVQDGELAGTPINLPGDINGTQLPSYSRLDLGLRRDWRVPGIGQDSRLTTALALTNLLDRTNILGLVAREDGGLRGIRGVSRRLQLEVGWRF